MSFLFSAPAAVAGYLGGILGLTPAQTVSVAESPAVQSAIVNSTKNVSTPVEVIETAVASSSVRNAVVNAAASSSPAPLGLVAQRRKNLEEKALKLKEEEAKIAKMVEATKSAYHPYISSNSSSSRTTQTNALNAMRRSLEEHRTQLTELEERLAKANGENARRSIQAQINELEKQIGIKKRLTTTRGGKRGSRKNKKQQKKRKSQKTRRA